MFNLHQGQNTEFEMPILTETILSHEPQVLIQAQQNYPSKNITSENSNESTKENSFIDFSKISLKGGFRKIIGEINRNIFINEFAKRDSNAKNKSFQTIGKYLVEAVEEEEIQHNELSTKSYWTLIKLTLLYMVMLFDNKRSI